MSSRFPDPATYMQSLLDAENPTLASSQDQLAEAKQSIKDQLYETLGIMPSEALIQHTIQPVYQAYIKPTVDQLGDSLRTALSSVGDQVNDLKVSIGDQFDTAVNKVGTWIDSLGQPDQVISRDDMIGSFRGLGSRFNPIENTWTEMPKFNSVFEVDKPPPIARWVPAGDGAVNAQGLVETDEGLNDLDRSVSQPKFLSSSFTPRETAPVIEDRPVDTPAPIEITSAPADQIGSDAANGIKTALTTALPEEEATLDDLGPVGDVAGLALGIGAGIYSIVNLFKSGHPSMPELPAIVNAPNVTPY